MLVLPSTVRDFDALHVCAKKIQIDMDLEVNRRNFAFDR